MVSRPRSGLALWRALPTLASLYILLLYTNREQCLLTVPRKLKSLPGKYNANLGWREYTLLSKDFIDCVSAIHSETKVTYKTFKSTDWAIKTTEFTKVTDVHAVPVIGWNINHPGIGPATVTATATSSFDAISSTSTQTPIPGSNGISVGAKVGLGVGIPMAIMGVIVGAFLVYLRIKRHAKKGIATQLQPWRYGPELSEFEVSLHSTGGTPQRPLTELSAIREPSEMEG